MADYLRTIDTIEKAYILGLVHKYNIALTIHNKKIIKLLKSHSIISSQYNNNCIITLGDNINNEKEIINNAILDFPNFSEECKLLFVRGVYESNFNSSFLLVTDNLKPIFNIIIENYIIFHQYALDVVFILALSTSTHIRASHTLLEAFTILFHAIRLCAVTTFCVF
jgi:hypothetical protein